MPAEIRATWVVEPKARTPKYSVDDSNTATTTHRNFVLIESPANRIAAGLSDKDRTSGGQHTGTWRVNLSCDCKKPRVVDMGVQRVRENEPESGGYRDEDDVK
jgi:hypothetical protein